MQTLPVLLAFLVACTLGFYTFANEDQGLKIVKNNNKLQPNEVHRLPINANAKTLKGPAVSNDDMEEALQDSLDMGYAVAKVTRVNQGFAGCGASETIRFADGVKFQCSEKVSYSKKDGNAVVILKNPETKLYKVFIGEEEYIGTLLGAK